MSPMLQHAVYAAIVMHADRLLMFTRRCCLLLMARLLPSRYRVHALNASALRAGGAEKDTARLICERDVAASSAHTISLLLICRYEAHRDRASCLMRRRRPWPPARDMQQDVADTAFVLYARVTAYL